MTNRTLVCALIGAHILPGCASQQSAPPFTFNERPSYRVPGLRRTAAVVAADLDGDSRKDLLLLSGEGGRIKVLINKPTGFAPVAEDPKAANSASDLALGDFNEDGRIDFAISHHDLAQVWIFLGRGAARFAPPKKVDLRVSKPHAHMILCTDVNADGHLDCVLAQADDNRLHVLLGNGKAEFRSSPGSPFATDSHPYVTAAGDFNKDRALDLATPNWYGKSLSIFLCDGSGRFRPAPGSPIKGFTGPTSMEVGDLNGDGNLDLAVGNDDSKEIRLLAGDGKGRFRSGVISDLVSPTECFAPTLADLNGDGRLDVLANATNGAPSFPYWINLGDGRFTAAKSIPCAAGANRFCVTDLNGDGRVDMVVGTWDEDRAYVWLGK